MSRGKGIVAAFLAVAVLPLSGCGVNIVAHKAGALKSEMAAPGIYYTLPKTELHVAIPVVVEKIQSGRIGVIFDDCLAACRAEDTAREEAEAKEKAKTKDAVEAREMSTDKVKARESACVLRGPLTLKVLRPQVTPKGAPDPAHAYYVSVTPELFTSVKHEMTFGDSGVITDASSSAVNNFPEVAVSVLGTLVNAFGAGTLSLMERIRRDDQLTDVENLKCPEAKNIASEISKFQGRIKAENDKLDSWLAPDKPIEARFAKLLVDRATQRLTRIEEELARYRTEADLEVVRKSYRYLLGAKGALVPDEFTSLNEVLELRSEAPTEEADLKSPPVLELIASLGLVFSAEVEAPTVEQCENCAATDGAAGYRYRLPAMGKLRIWMTESDGKETDLLLDSFPVAQYGAVAALPGRFDGKSGAVGISLSPVAGTLRKVSIGTEALPATVVTAPIDALAVAAEDRKKRKEEAAKEAASADKTALERERDLLKLQKEIRDLRQELGQ